MRRLSLRSAGTSIIPPEPAGPREGEIDCRLEEFLELVPLQSGALSDPTEDFLLATRDVARSLLVRSEYFFKVGLTHAAVAGGARLA